MHLVRDVLDKQVLDRNDAKVGKVDGLVIVLRAHRAPRVVAIEMSLATLAARLHPRLGMWVARLQRWRDPQDAEPARIRFEHVVRTGIDVFVDIDAERTRALTWEKWLREHVIGRIPGSGR